MIITYVNDYFIGGIEFIVWKDILIKNCDFDTDTDFYCGY